MSFLDKIENIQKKPDHTKQKMAFGSAVFLTLVVVISWLSFADPFAPISSKSGSVADSLQGTATAAKPMMDQIKESFEQMKDYSELLSQQTAASTSQQQATDTEEEILNEEVAPDQSATPPEVLKYLENATLNQ